MLAWIVTATMPFLHYVDKIRCTHLQISRTVWLPDVSLHIFVAIRALANVLGRSTTAVAKSLTRELPGKPPRHEIFPLPRPDERMVQAYLPVRHNREDLVTITDLCVIIAAGLNTLDAGGRACGFSPLAPTTAHREVFGHVTRRAYDFCHLMCTEQAKQFDPANALQAFEPAHAAPRPTLNPDMLALPSKAALCSPERLVDKQFQGILERIKDIFPDHPLVVKSVRVTKNELHDYAKVVGRMHQCGKLAFMLHPKGVAAFFVVAKPNGQQRPIWNGAEISEACRRPVAPPRLGNPASFVDICVAPGSHVFFSKRDASSYFDVLRAPVDAHPWFGFPPLSASLLCETLNMDIEELCNVVKDPDTILPTTLVYLVSVTFPMGIFLVFLHCPGNYHQRCQGSGH